MIPPTTPKNLVATTNEPIADDGKSYYFIHYHIFSLKAQWQDKSGRLIRIMPVIAFKVESYRCTLKHALELASAEFEVFLESWPYRRVCVCKGYDEPTIIKEFSTL